MCCGGFFIVSGVVWTDFFFFSPPTCLDFKAENIFVQGLRKFEVHGVEYVRESFSPPTSAVAVLIEIA